MRILHTLGPFLFLGLCCTHALAEISRWDNVAIIPGTEGIEIPGNRRIFRGVNWEYADLDGVTFRSLVFAEANLEHAHLRQSQFQSADFRHVNLAAGDLSQATFLKGTFHASNLAAAKVAAASINSTDFSSSNLTEANLAKSNLYKANFGNVTFVNANLQDTMWSFSSISGANLSHADLRGAEGIGDLLSSAVSLDNTILPDGTVKGFRVPAGTSWVWRNHESHAVNVEQSAMLAGGELDVRLDASEWKSTMRFRADTEVSLLGNIKLAFEPGVDLEGQVGRQFQLFDWTGVSFAGILHVTGPLVWDTSALASQGTVTLLAVPEPCLPGCVTAGGMLTWLIQRRSRMVR